MPGGQGEVIAVIAEEVQDAVVLVQDDRGGHELLQEMGVERLGPGRLRMGAALAAAQRGDGLDVGDVEGGRGQVLHLALALVDVDLLGAAHRFEQVDVLARRLALAQEQIAVVLERLMEDGEQAPPQHRLEIDHHVAAADQVQLAEGRIGKDVVGGKNDHPAHFLADLVLIVLLDEEFGQPVRGDVVDDVLRKQPAARLFDGPAVHVGGKDLDIPADLHLLHHFPEQDGDGIGLLAGGAACAPYTDGFILGGPLHDLVDGVVLELFKKGGVPEKVGHADEDLLHQSVHLVGRVPQEPRKIGQGGGVGHQHPPLDPPQDGGALVVGEVDAAGVFEDGVDVGEGLLLREQLILLRQGRVPRAAQQSRRQGKIEDLLRDLLGGQDEIGQAGADGAAGHPVEFGALGRLRNDQAPALLHRLDPVGAVGAGARQHHHDGVLLLLLRQGTEKQVDGVVEGAGVVVGQHQPAALDGQILFGRDQIDMVGPDGHAVLGLPHRHFGVLGKDVRHQALVIGGEVLDHHKAQPAVGRHIVEELLQGLQPAGGRADADDGGGDAGVVRIAHFFLLLAL